MAANELFLNSKERTQLTNEEFGKNLPQMVSSVVEAVSLCGANVFANSRFKHIQSTDKESTENNRVLFLCVKKTDKISYFG